MNIVQLKKAYLDTLKDRIYLDYLDLRDLRPVKKVWYWDSGYLSVGKSNSTQDGAKVYTSYVVFQRSKKILKDYRYGYTFACVAYDDFDIFTKEFNPHIYVGREENP